MRFVPLRKLYVHSWGGDASQMLAWNLYFLLQDKFPNRKLTFVHHSSGVTRREFGSNLKQDDKLVKSIDDYDLEIKRFYIVRKFRTFFNRILLKLGFVSNCQSLSSIDKMHTWLYSIRGSYNNIPITKERLEQIFALFDINIRRNGSNSKIISIHYRLGDLLFLNSKSYIDKNSILVLLNTLASSHGNLNIELFSDSPQFALDFLENSQSNFKITVNQGNIKLIFEKGIEAEVFIGSNSKISHLIALYRLYSFEHKITYMPMNQNENVFKLVDKSSIKNHLSLY